MGKSLGNSLLIRVLLERVRGVELRYYMSPRTTAARRVRLEALDDAAADTGASSGSSSAPTSPTSTETVPDAFVAAMDDDLGTPAAVAVLHDIVREGNKALTDGDVDAVRRVAASVRAMLDVLGLDPADPSWDSTAGSDALRLTSVIDALVVGMLAERGEARAAKDFARADAIRDRLKAAGIALEDTPDGPKWTLES